MLRRDRSDPYAHLSVSREIVRIPIGASVAIVVTVASLRSRMDDRRSTRQPIDIETATIVVPNKAGDQDRRATVDPECH